MTGESSPHGNKRKKLATDEKENVLRDSSKANTALEGLPHRIVPRESNSAVKQADFNSDLFAVSRENYCQRGLPDLNCVQAVCGNATDSENLCSCRDCSRSRRMFGTSSRQYNKGYCPSRGPEVGSEFVFN